MKNIKCMIGLHDWEVCRTSKLVGRYGWFLEGIPWCNVNDKDNEHFNPAVERVCLRCGKKDGGIEHYRKEVAKRLKKIGKIKREKARREALAKDLCKMGEQL